jgi:ammonia channel protein AmtB
MTAHPGLTAACTLGILLIIPALSVLYREFHDRVGFRASTGLSAVICATSFALWIVVSLFFPAVLSSPLEWPAAALAALGGFLSSLTVRDTTSHPLPALAFSAIWTVAVFAPIAIIVIFPTSIGLSITAGPLDLGGALPVHAAVGSGALVVLTFARRWTAEDRSHVRPRSWLLLGSGLVMWAGWIVALVGLEVAVDGVVTPRIVTNTIVAPLLAVLGWLVIQRIRTATTTASSAIAGLVSGLVAISAGAAYFTPLWAGVTGAAAGIACSIFASGWSKATGRHAWFIVAAHLLAAAVGLIALGLFSTNFGMIYVGQIALLEVQLVSVILVVLWSGLVAFLLWLVLQRVAHTRSVLSVPFERADS